MLAANFLTADELGLSELERTALIGILGMLERGELKWHPADEARSHIKKNSFNMSLEFIKGPCGSIGCIAGWCDALYGTEFMSRSLGWPLRPRRIDLLFFPPMSYRLWPHLTAENAAQATRSYLTTGDPQWPTPVKL